MNPSNPILFFDGVCNLCNKSVDYIIRHDKHSVFQFASLQSQFAQKVLSKYNQDPKDLSTVILLLNQKTYTLSRAAAQVFIQLEGWRSILGRIIYVVPKPLADWVYKWIARNRYRWFGQSETCRIPTPSERSRFLG